MIFKLYIYYYNSSVVRRYYFDSIFNLYRFMYSQLKKDNVKDLKVVKLDV